MSSFLVQLALKAISPLLSHLQPLNTNCLRLPNLVCPPLCTCLYGTLRVPLLLLRCSCGVITCLGGLPVPCLASWHFLYIAVLESCLLLSCPLCPAQAQHRKGN